MPEFNTAAQGQALSENLISTVTLAENDLGHPRILAIICAVVEQLVDASIQENPANIDAMTLAKANIVSAHAYFSAIDEPVSEDAE